MTTKLEILKKMAEAGIKLKDGKISSKDIQTLMKKFKLEATWADKFREKTKTKEDSAELAESEDSAESIESAELTWADKFRKKTQTIESAKKLIKSKGKVCTKADAMPAVPAIPVVPANQQAIKKGDIVRIQHGTLDNQPITYITVKDLDVRNALEKHPQVIKVGENVRGKSTDKDYWLAIPRGVSLKKFIDEIPKEATPVAS